MYPKHALRICSLIFLLLTSIFSWSQTTISGNIVDTDGFSLIGANISIVGTSEGGIADIDGNFSLTTSKNLPFTIEVSYTGYANQVIEVTDNSPLMIVLSEGLLIDEVVVSASRKREKVQEAPASISVINSKKLESSAQAVDPIRNLISTAGVQLQQQSAARINISMRGSSGLFGTSVFPILDYRSLIGPGVGTFQSDQAGISSIDLARIEVVRGPGSALYGPGVTQGVVHFISKNPIDYPGTTIEIIGGELATFGGALRYASANENKTFGYKINAQYKRGDEFTLDPSDPDDAAQISLFQTQVVEPVISNGIIDPTQPGSVLINAQDLDDDGDGNPMQSFWKNLAVNTTLEFRPADNLTLNLSGGFNSASSVFYNEQGEGLANAKEFWTQARMQKGGLFAQFFYLDNDGGNADNPTFLYQTGNRSSIARTQTEAQVQYNFETPTILNADWTAGFDYRFSSQDTEHRVYGRNEDDDDFSVIGAYIQGKFALTDKLDMVLAGRYDKFNFIDESAFSPRAAFVFKAAPKHTFRASYNRATSTVSNLQLNVDFPLATVIPGSFDVWLYGNKTTQTFSDNPTISWFNSLIPDVPVGTPGLPLAVPYALVNASVLPQIIAGIEANPQTAPLAPIVAAVLNGVNPATLGFTGSLTDGFNIFNATPLPIVDAPISQVSSETTYEFGYKGLLGDKFAVSLDIYNIDQNNFSQFTAISPAYLLIGYESLPTDLGSAVQNATADALVAALIANAGMDQATAMAVGAQLSAVIAGAYTAGGDAALNVPSPALNGFSLSQILGGLPFHATTQSLESPDNGVTHVAAGYRTFDNINYWGADLGLEYYFDEDLSFFGNYSWVSETDFMPNVVGVEGLAPLPFILNIPKNKFRLGFNYTPNVGIRGSLSFQHDDSFNANAGQFSGPTDEKNLVDAGVGYKFTNGLILDVSAQNVFDSEYRAYKNMPKIGRRLLAKVRYDF